MKINVDDDARMKMRQTAKYIHKQFGRKSRLKFRRDLGNVIKLLRKNPNLGAQDLLLSNRPIVYRSVVINKLNKLVYRIADDNIFIVDFWDTRREPITQANQLKD